MPRLDKGLKRQLSDDEDGNNSKGTGTLSQFLRKRRRGVAKAVEEAHNLDFDTEQCETGHEWSDLHEAEKQFQQSKQSKLLVEAFEYGGLISSEITEDLHERHEVRHLKDEANDKKLIADRKRRERAAERQHLNIQWQDKFGGKKCWIQDVTNNEKLKQVVESKNMTCTADRWKADLFVVEDVTHPPERVRWIAMLMGKVLVDSRAVEGNGGLLLSFKPARSKALTLHVTKKFKEDHDVIWGILKRS